VEQQNLTVFRSRLRDDVPSEYDDVAQQLEERVHGFDGFVEFKMFYADDGERLALVTFTSDEAEAAWRDDFMHRATQEAGRQRFYSEYDVAVCSVQRRNTWRSSGA
jgi:heme-degrading monooxygenase HmoA